MSNTDSADKLASAVGLTRNDMLSIWADVKANQALLGSCRRHSFAAIDGGVPFSKYRCSACGGVADGVAVAWYMRGLEHAK